MRAHFPRMGHAEREERNVTGRCVYDSNPHIKALASWCRQAKSYADYKGFAAPCDDFEYQFMLGYFYNNRAAYKAVEQLQAWREKSSVSTEETEEREEAR